MKWYHYIICTALIICGIFCSLNLYKIWTATSNVVGSVSSIETVNDYEEVAKFDYGVIELVVDDDDITLYTNSTSFSAVDFDGTKTDYAVLFNDNLASDVTIYAGQIDVVFTINFYLTTGELATTAILDVSIKFYESSTLVDISITNADNSVAYLTQYMNVNGAIIKIVEKGG